MAPARAGKQEGLMPSWTTRLLAFFTFLSAFATLFAVVSALGGLGPGELSIVLLVTLPVSVALYRGLTTLLRPVRA
jgi:hypothetical protein